MLEAPRRTRVRRRMCNSGCFCDNKCISLYRACCVNLMFQLFSSKTSCVILPTRTVKCRPVLVMGVHTVLAILVIAFSDQMTNLCAWLIRGDKMVEGLTRISAMTKANSLSLQPRYPRPGGNSDPLFRELRR